MVESVKCAYKRTFQTF